MVVLEMVLRCFMSCPVLTCTVGRVRPGVCAGIYVLSMAARMLLLTGLTVGCDRGSVVVSDYLKCLAVPIAVRLLGT
jgi:uncharacterized protein involved in response to NO